MHYCQVNTCEGRGFFPNQILQQVEKETFSPFVSFPSCLLSFHVKTLFLPFQLSPFPAFQDPFLYYSFPPFSIISFALLFPYVEIKGGRFKILKKMRDLLYFKSPAFNLFSRSFLLSIITCHPLYLSCLSPITFVLYTFLLLFCSSTHFLITLTLSNNRLISRFAFPISFLCHTFYYFSMIFFNFVVSPFSLYHSSCFL